MAALEREAPEPLLLDLKQAAALLNIPAATLHTWAWAGAHGLPVVRIGRKRMFRRSDLIDWIDRHVCVPKPLTSSSQTKYRAVGGRSSAGKED